MTRRRAVLLAALGLFVVLGLAGMLVLARASSLQQVRAAIARRVGAVATPIVGSRPTPTPPSAVELRVDTSRALRPISPLIYGVSVASREELQATGAGLNRWGGNPNTRYNWTYGSAWNAARDWEFRNYGGQPTPPSSVADAMVGLDRSLGVQTVMTVPAIGWVASNGDNDTHSVNVPSIGGPPLTPGSEAIAGYDPSTNRSITSIRSLPRKNAPFADPPDVSAGVVYQDEWINHLVGRFGSAAAGGVAYYAIDNEPDLWPVTHTDVHPVEPGYDDMLRTFVEYAEAIKDVDPTAQVLGPTLSGWTAYWYSALDRGSDAYRTHADRRAHGDVPFLAWWLDAVRRHDEQVGRRTLDVLDVHYYPQGAAVFGGGGADATNALRLRSTRSLWDPSYVDESWIAEPVELIPRLHAWIDQYYPGTRLAIDEWNWGADKTMNGALAIADVLGIYGREGLDMAAYWTSPPPGSPGARAFAMYTNYDGQGHSFGDASLADTSSAPDYVSSYASRDSATGDVLIIAVNKTTDRALPTTIELDAPRTGRARIFRYAPGDAAITDAGTLDVNGASIHVELPASSISLLELSAGA